MTVWKSASSEADFQIGSSTCVSQKVSKSNGQRPSDGRVYILPTFFGLFFLATLVVFFIAAFAFDSDFAFVIVFFLFGVFIVSMFHTHYNLHGLELSAARAVSRFVGEEADVTVTIANPSRRTRYSVKLNIPSRGLKGFMGRGQDVQAALVDEIPGKGIATTTLKIHLSQRGRFMVPQIGFSTAYPLGLFRSWMRRRVTVEYHAYPKPHGLAVLPEDHALQSQVQAKLISGDDDFFGHRSYQAGDSPRHIDWKALAKGRPALTKVFRRSSGRPSFFRWQDTAFLKSDEDRLSQLALWLRTAFRARQGFGLALPEIEIPAGEGESHYHRCLRVLAEFGMTGNEGGSS